MAIIETDVAFALNGGNVGVANPETAEDSARPNLTIIEGGLATALHGARGVLLATVEQSAYLYTEVTTELNKGREAAQKIQIVPEDELPGRAADWLTQSRFMATQTENGLYETPDSPLIVLALPNTPISRQETVRTWANARDGKLLHWGGRLAFLNQWPADALSGYDHDNANQLVRFVVVETAYQRQRRGIYENQSFQLRKDQSDNPLITSATLFEGGVLARGVADVSFDTWEQTLVRDLGLKPNKDNRMPIAFLDHNGQAVVGQADWGYTGVSRRAVR